MSPVNYANVTMTMANTFELSDCPLSPMQHVVLAGCIAIYGEKWIGDERERCKKWCQQVSDHHRAQPDCSLDDEEPTFRDGEACGAEDCVEAINLQGQWP